MFKALFHKYKNQIWNKILNFVNINFKFLVATELKKLNVWQFSKKILFVLLNYQLFCED